MLKESVVLLLTALASCTGTTEHLLQPESVAQPQGFAVQTGYEGFLVPSEQSSSNLLHSIPLAGIPLAAAAPVLGLKAIAKAGLWFFGLVMVVLTGAGLASAVCAFTPLCTLGLAFGRQNSHQLQTLTTFVHNALDKYKRLQKT